MSFDDDSDRRRQARASRAQRGITTCVHAAMLASDVERLRLFQEEDDEACTDWRRYFSDVSHLHNAAFSGDLRSVKRLIRHSHPSQGSAYIVTDGPRLLKVSNRGIGLFGRTYAGFFAGTTPLMMACQQGHISVVKFFISYHHADINDVDSSGLSPLMIASASGQLETVKFLVAKRAVLGMREHKFGMTALILAGANNYAKIVKCLIHHGADTMDTDSAGRTVMHYAAWNFNVEMVTFLCSHGDREALLSSRDGNGNTPLHLLVSDEKVFPASVNISELEVERLRDVQEATKAYQHTVVVKVARKISRGHGVPAEESLCLVRMINNGASLTDRNDEGQTDIHVLCSRLNKVKYSHGYILTDTPTETQTLLVLLNILVTMGAQTNDLDNHNLTPLDYCVRQENWMATQLLEPDIVPRTNITVSDCKTLEQTVDKYGWHRMIHANTFKKDIEWMAAAAIAQKKESRFQGIMARLVQ